jgi:ferrochelatase
VLPLFPQYAGATTGAVTDALEHALSSYPNKWQVDVIKSYASDAGYIDALAESISGSKSFRDGTPRIIFSFHGIPQSQHRAGDPYADQCQTTAALVAARLDLPADRWMVTFQSRFGPLPWLQPYTDHTLAELPAKGIKNVLLVCPGFSVDCLETIEEIKILNRDIFKAAGGETFSYVRALNASAAHAQLLSELVHSRITALSADAGDKSD